MFDWSRIVNHPLFNIGCFLVLRQVTSYFGLDHSENLDIIRTLYLGSQFIVIALSFYLLSVIKSKNGNTFRQVTNNKILRFFFLIQILHLYVMLSQEKSNGMVHKPQIL